jgi:hypothetical protein
VQWVSFLIVLALMIGLLWSAGHPLGEGELLMRPAQGPATAKAEGRYKGRPEDAERNEPSLA